MFDTGRGGACFHASGPAPPPGRRGFFSRNPRPTPVWGLFARIPWMGPLFSPPIFNRGRLGDGRGRGPGREQGRGMSKNMPRPVPSSRAGRRKGPGARVFRGPGVPVTNSSLAVLDEPVQYPNNNLSLYWLDFLRFKVLEDTIP